MSAAPERYEDPYAARFRVETATDGVRQIVVPAQRNIFVVAFIVVWLCLWTVGGFVALGQLLLHFNLFTAFWLCAWAVAWLFVVSCLAWMAAGRETIRVLGSDLEISAQALFVRRAKLYRGSQIRGLAATGTPQYGYNGRQVMAMPLLTQPTSGGIKFSYGSRTVFAGCGLDETEGRALVALLAPQLPKSAVGTELLVGAGA